MRTEGLGRHRPRHQLMPAVGPFIGLHLVFFLDTGTPSGLISIATKGGLRKPIPYILSAPRREPVSVDCVRANNQGAPLPKLGI